MHKTQQLIVLIGIVLVLLMGVYPPWIYVDDSKVGHPMGYGPIWKPPMERQHESASILGIKLQLDLQSQTANSIDLLRLLAQIAILAAVTGGAVVLFRRASACCAHGQKMKHKFVSTLILIGPLLCTLITSQASARLRTAASGAIGLTSPVRVTTKKATSHRITAQKYIQPHQFSGNASWYGAQFNGRKTASGEIFNMNKLTAAHLHLPMSTRVLVENPRNGKAAVIKVNDRGPYVKNRILDLSREGAKQIGTMSMGVGYVECMVLTQTAGACKSGKQR